MWSIVEHIAEHPGQGRSELAEQFSLSERQFQADLDVIRGQIGLPIVRSHGYRFADAPAPGHALALADLVALAPMIQQALADPAASRDPVLALADRLPSLFSPALRNLARATLCPPPGMTLDSAAFLLLAAARLRAQPVRLQYVPGTAPGFAAEPIVVPQVLMPYEESWYIIGPCQQLQRVGLFSLDAVEAIAPTAPGA